jgi:hypothetical protein
MRARRNLPLGLALLAATGFVSVSTGAGNLNDGEAPIALFNGRDLSGWYCFIPHKDGASPRTDLKGVFKVEDGIIHVSGEEFGALTTKKQYENYRLIVEFKWGTKKWPPRQNAVRDSGVLLHCVGPDKIWTKSIECQIQEHDCGDFWMVDGASLEVGGQVRAGGRAIKTADAEKPSGEWNRVEVVCRGDTITNIINGVVVNEGRRASVSRGRILLQSEGAEIFFRAVELLPLTETSPSRG